MAPPYAFVTLLTSDSYLPGALALAAALGDIHKSPAVPPEVDFETVCLVTPESVDVSTIKLLRRAYNVVVGVELIAQEDDKNLRLLGESFVSVTCLEEYLRVESSEVLLLNWRKLVVIVLHDVAVVNQPPTQKLGETVMSVYQISN